MSLSCYIFHLTVSSQEEEESELSIDDPDKIISLPCVAGYFNIVVLIGLLRSWLRNSRLVKLTAIVFYLIFSVEVLVILGYYFLSSIGGG